MKQSCGAIPLPSGSPRPVGNFLASSAAWSPDGRYYFFLSFAATLPDVYAMQDRPGPLLKVPLTPIQLTAEPLQFYFVAPSSDGAPLEASSLATRIRRSCSACRNFTASLEATRALGEEWQPTIPDFTRKTSAPRKSTLSSCNSTEISLAVSTYHYWTAATMPNADSAIHLEHVSRYYTMGESSVRAVDDVSLSIPEGQFLALLGSSGSGKSTLLNLIAGLDRVTSGSILARGQDLAALSPLELARYRRNTIGMVFQSFNLLPRMTLEENIELPLRLAEVERAERAGRVREALERVRLTHRLGHRPTELSGGEQQRVAIARALVNRPKILLADEPTGNLDSATGESILALLRDLQQQLGMTIVMVTHERPLAERFANRLATMGDGKLLSAAASTKGVAS